MASPFFGPPPDSVVGSSPPHPAVSPEMGSTMNVAEMMVGSAAAAGVRVGAVGGLLPTPATPQLKRPPEPVMLTPPFAQAAPEGPELAQSTVPPPPANWMLPSTLSPRVGGECTRGASDASA